MSTAGEPDCFRYPGFRSRATAEQSARRSSPRIDRYVQHSEICSISIRLRAILQTAISSQRQCARALTLTVHDNHLPILIATTTRQSPVCRSGRTQHTHLTLSEMTVPRSRPHILHTAGIGTGQTLSSEHRGPRAETSADPVVLASRLRPDFDTSLHTAKTHLRILDAEASKSKTRASSHPIRTPGSYVGFSACRTMSHHHDRAPSRNRA